MKNIAFFAMFLFTSFQDANAQCIHARIHYCDIYNANAGKGSIDFSVLKADPYQQKGGENAGAQHKKQKNAKSVRFELTRIVPQSFFDLRTARWETEKNTFINWGPGIEPQISCEIMMNSVFRKSSLACEYGYVRVIVEEIKTPIREMRCRLQMSELVYGFYKMHRYENIPDYMYYNNPKLLLLDGGNIVMELPSMNSDKLANLLSNDLTTITH